MTAEFDGLGRSKSSPNDNNETFVPPEVSGRRRSSCWVESFSVSSPDRRFECKTPPSTDGPMEYHKGGHHMTHPATFGADIETAAQRIKQTSERVLELSKANGLIWLEAYEKLLDGVLKLEEETANELDPDWVKTLVSTQAEVVREMSEAFLGAIKDRLK